MLWEWLTFIFSYFWASAPGDLPPCAQAALKFPGFSCADRPILGEGSAARAYVLQKINEDNSVQELVLKLQKIDSRDRKAAVEKERDLLLQAKHPNIVRLFDSAFDDKFAYFLMEYASEGTLRSVIDNYHEYFENPKNGLAIFLQILDAVRYLHNEMKLVHGDIKDTNIVMVTKDNPKIIDFDLSVKYGEREVGHGTSGWMDPQFYQAEDESDTFVYDEKVDVYSLGVILYQIFHGGELPLGRGYEYNRKIRDGHYDVRANLPYEVVVAINGCLQSEPSMRLTLENLDRIIRTAYNSQYFKLTKEPLTLRTWQKVPSNIAEAVDSALAKNAEFAVLYHQII